jgi:hypothetical protein
VLYEKRCHNLLVAAEGGFEDVVGALLAAGVDVGARDRAGRTALVAASAGSNTDERSSSISSRSRSRRRLLYIMLLAPAVVHPHSLGYELTPCLSCRRADYGKVRARLMGTHPYSHIEL